MHKFGFSIGATVHCKNEDCGKLEKLVVDPETLEVTHLIVKNGLFRPEDRIVPLTVVDRAKGNYVMLAINDTGLEKYPAYRFFDINIEGHKNHQKIVGSSSVTHQSSLDGFSSDHTYDSVIQRQSVHNNVPENGEIIKRGTPVYGADKKIGVIDHVIVEGETGELSHLVIDRGLLSCSKVIPITQIEGLHEKKIIVNLAESEINKFPDYSKHADHEIVMAMREQSKENSFLEDLHIVVIDGVVMMEGAVPDLTTKNRLEEIARKLDGVVAVENRLYPENAPGRGVLAALAYDPRTEDAVIEVLEDRGLVRLFGTVDHADRMEAAVEIAESQPGVLKVINGLTVEKAPRFPAFLSQLPQVAPISK
jgi:hypothetical protein